MRGTLLFLRARGVAVVGVAIVLEIVAVRLFGSMTLKPLVTSHISFAIAVVAPIIVAMAIGVTSGSPAADAEARGGRRLAFYRALHRGILVLSSGVATAAALSLAGRGDLLWIAMRNLLGFAGLALVAAALARPSVSWMLPLLWLSLPPMFFDFVENDPGGVWTFYAQPAGTANSTIFSASVFVIGAAVTIAAEPPIYRRWGLRVSRRDLGAASASTARPPKHTNHSN